MLAVPEASNPDRHICSGLLSHSSALLPLRHAPSWSKSAFHNFVLSHVLACLTRSWVHSCSHAGHCRRLTVCTSARLGSQACTTASYQQSEACCVVATIQHKGSLGNKVENDGNGNFCLSPHACRRCQAVACGCERAGEQRVSEELSEPVSE